MRLARTRCTPMALRPERFGALAYHYGNRRLTFLKSPQLTAIVEDLGEHPSVDAALDAHGVAPGQRPAMLTGARPASDLGGDPCPLTRPARTCASASSTASRRPICLTWEVTYGCNLACAHCLSSSGKRDPRELSTDECKGLIDELARMRVFYVNVGGGEPLVRRDFLELVDHAVERRVGVKFSTNGALITPRGGQRGSRRPTISTCRSRSTAPPPRPTIPVRGPGSYAMARRGMDRLAEAGLRAVQDLGGDDPPQHPRARRARGDRAGVRRAAADHSPAPVRARRLGVGRAASHRRASSASSTSG